MAAGGKHLVVQIYCKITNKPALAKYLSDFLKQKTGKWSRGERCISLSHLSHIVPHCIVLKLVDSEKVNKYG